MSGTKNRRRHAVALTLSTAAHLILIGILINQAPPAPYELPHPFQPPMDVQIVPEPPIKIPRIVVPPLPVPKPETAPPQITPPQVKPPPTPPKPQPAVQPSPAAPSPVPPKPTPTPPTPPVQQPKPTPPAPTPPKPSLLPAPVAPSRAPTPAAPSVNPTPSPTPAPRPAPAPTVAAPAPPRIAPPAISSRPSLLNLHKSAKEAPPNVPTLPMAPSGAPAGGGGGGGAPAAGALGGSRLNGLSPYPYGAMPSGGPGLRGTLVGCANAEAVGLSSVEKAHCNSRFGAGAARAPTLDGIDPAKRAGFDKTAARQDAERRAQGAMPVGTTAGASGFGGLGPN